MITVTLQVDIILHYLLMRKLKSGNVIQVLGGRARTGAQISYLQFVFYSSYIYDRKLLSQICCIYSCGIVRKQLSPVYWDEKKPCFQENVNLNIVKSV